MARTQKIIALFLYAGAIGTSSAQNVGGGASSTVWMGGCQRAKGLCSTMQFRNHLIQMPDHARVFVADPGTVSEDAGSLILGKRKESTKIPLCVMIVCTVVTIRHPHQDSPASPARSPCADSPAPGTRNTADTSTPEPLYTLHPAERLWVLLGSMYCAAGQGKNLENLKKTVAFFENAGTIDTSSVAESRRSRVKYRSDGRLPTGEGALPRDVTPQPPEPDARPHLGLCGAILVLVQKRYLTSTGA